MYLKLLVGGGFLGSHSFKGRTLETEALGSRSRVRKMNCWILLSLIVLLLAVFLVDVYTDQYELMPADRHL